MRNFGKPIQTYATVQGRELAVAVQIDYQPFEPETREEPGCPAGIEIAAVYFMDKGCTKGKMSDDENEELVQRMIEECLGGEQE